MRSLFLAAALTTTCLAATPVFADITPEDAWSAYQDMMTRMGMTPTADVSREGDTLVVRNMVYSMTMDMGTIDISSTTTAPEIRFRARAGGTVAMWFAEPMQSISTVPVHPELGAETIETRSTLKFDGVSILSGSPENILFTLKDSVLQTTNSPVIFEGETIQPGLLATITGISGTYSLLRTQDDLSSNMDLTADSVVYDIDPIETDGETVEMGFAATGLIAKGTMSLPNIATGEFLKLILDESDVDMTMSFANSSSFMKISGENPPTSMDIQAATSLSTLGVTISEGNIGYDAGARDIEVGVSGTQIPGGQATMTMQEYTAGVLFPMTPAEEARPFKANIRLEQFTLPDIAWLLADPTGELPHDPATLRIALEGMVENGVDLFDIASLSAAEGKSTNIPFQVKTLTLSDLYLSLAGATIKGSGAGRFLEQDPITPRALPPFAGTLSLNLMGVTELINKLSASGLLPPGQAMSAQMMLGYLARPGAAPGELVSEIEITEDGEISANGEPLPF